MHSRRVLVVVAAALALCLPASAQAERLVPPGNSAANQYTEVIPSSGGQRDAERDVERDVVVADALGKGTWRALDSRGSVGSEVAEFAARTAPSPAGGAASTNRDQAPRKENDDTDRDGSGGEAPASGGGGSPSVSPPSGSSGAEEVLGQATGLSSGQLGILLPLLIVAVAVWAVGFHFRRRHRTA